MEEQNIVDPAYIKGFNQGYMISKYMPDVSDKLSIAESNSPQMQGFKDGRNQFMMEQVREKYPEWLKGGHPKYKEPPGYKNRDRDRDMDKS